MTDRTVQQTYRYTVGRAKVAAPPTDNYFVAVCRPGVTGAGNSFAYDHGDNTGAISVPTVTRLPVISHSLLCAYLVSSLCCSVLASPLSSPSH